MYIAGYFFSFFLVWFGLFLSLAHIFVMWLMSWWEPVCFCHMHIYFFSRVTNDIRWASQSRWYENNIAVSWGGYSFHRDTAQGKFFTYSQKSFSVMMTWEKYQATNTWPQFDSVCFYQPVHTCHAIFRGSLTPRPTRSSAVVAFDLTAIEVFRGDYIVTLSVLVRQTGHHERRREFHFTTELNPIVSIGEEVIASLDHS